MVKDTKSIPKLTHREKETINRFETFYLCSGILKDFFEMEFKSYNAFKAIMQFHFPAIDLVKLKRFWNCQLMDKEIVSNVKHVYSKLKSN